MTAATVAATDLPGTPVGAVRERVQADENQRVREAFQQRREAVGRLLGTVEREHEPLGVALDELVRDELGTVLAQWCNLRERRFRVDLEQRVRPDHR